VEQALDAVLQRAMQTYEVKGIAAAVLLPDRRLWEGAAGVSHATSPVTRDMRFSIWSTTKIFTGALILQLAEEGKLGLEDSLGLWLPVYEFVDPAITIRQLLNHTSGVFEMNDHPAIRDAMMQDPERRVTPEEIVSNYLLPPYFAPGTGWRYSNSNYLLLGMVAVQAGEADLSTQMRQRFWEPLGMGGTFFAVEEEISGTMAHGWSNRGDGGPLRDIADEPKTSLYSGSWASGAVISTAADLARWADALYGGRVLAPASLESMLAFHFPASAWGGIVNGYGLGTHAYGSEFVDGEVAYGHAGGFDGFTSALVYLPQHETSIAVLLNQELAIECILDVLQGLVLVVKDESGAAALTSGRL
jgi:D-alanyl-D-alanine carboxypeptidase